VRSRQAAAERDAPFFDIGARDVQLQRVDPLRIRQDPRHFDVLVECSAADVDHHHRAPFAQLGQTFGDEAMDADPLQSDRIEHPGRRFDDARRRVPFAFGEEEAFDRDAAERCEIDDVRVLDAVAEASARRNQRIGKCERSDLEGEIRHRQCPATASQTIRWASNTGPSMHVRVWWAAPPFPPLARTTQL
jgi:hypothetical protein